MNKFVFTLTLASLMGASAVWAAPSGTLRQAHEVQFGNASDLDPISRGRVFTVTEKIMSRLVRPGIDGKNAPDLAVSWSPILQQLNGHSFSEMALRFITEGHSPRPTWSIPYSEYRILSWIHR